MPRHPFNDFLNLDTPTRGRGRGRGRGGNGARGGGGRGGGPGRGGGRGGRGGGGGRGGFDPSRARGGGRNVRGGHFGADYSSVQLDYNRFNSKTYHKFEPSVQPFAPDEERDNGPRRDTPRRFKSFAPHGAGNSSSTNASGTATPITSGLGYHKSGPRTAAREIDGVVTWGGGFAPLFVKAGELFRDGEVDVVKRDGDVFVVEHYSLSDPSAPQMHDLHDEVEVEIADQAHRNQILEAVALHRHDAPTEAVAMVTQEPAAEDDDEIDDESIERVLSEHIEMLAVDDQRAVATETTIVVETTMIDPEEERVVYSPSAPVAVLEFVSEASMDDESDGDEVISDDELFVVDTTGITGSSSPRADDLLFVIDTTGNADTTSDTIIYDTPAAPSTSRAPPRQRTLDEEAIVYRPRLINDPVASSSSSRAPPPANNFELRGVYVDPRVGMNRKDRKAAKREKRTRNKRARRKAGGGNGNGALHIASDGSDLDWGSDGPPKILSVSGSHDLVGDEELDPDLDDAALERYTASMARIRADNAAMAYMDSDSDEWDDEDMEEMKETKKEMAGARLESEEDDDDDDDDEDSSGDDFTALADAYSEDEFASDGEAKLFNGVTKWDDSDESDDDEEAAEIDENNAWFLDSMESALDGGAMAASRKERKAVFRAVATGSFNDDFAIAPAKKNKKPPLNLPQELQDQWARDREKKAEKKRDRELARALALLDPSIGFGRKANKKKGKKGQAAAARIAHLIPGSAAEVAELFDIPTDEELGSDGGWGVTYHRRNPLLPPTLADVDRMIQDFMSDPGRSTLQLPPMEKEARKKVHMLAECYDLKSKSKGKGASRFPILIKLARSGLRNEKTRNRLVAAGDITGGGFYKALYARKNKGGDKDNKFSRGTGASVRAKEGDLVGEGAEKIGQDNVGHRLLSMMGWTEGVTIGLGGERGLEAPIVAVVKNTKRGLGSYGMGYGAGFGNGSGASVGSAF